MSGAGATRVLEFADGLSARPILRPAHRDELRHSGGTSVAVRLRVNPFEQAGLLNRGAGALDLPTVCGRLAPALDCDLTVQINDDPAVSVISANDWLTSPGQTLIRRLGHAEGDLWQYAPVSVDAIAERLRLLVVGDKTVGRASLAPSPPAAAEADGSVLDVNGVAVVGGLSSASLGGIAGVVLGVPEKADRASAELLVPAAVWKEWATEQAELWADHLNEHHYPFDVGSISVSLLVRLKADTGRVELCHNGQKYMHAAEIVKWASERDRVIALSEFACDCELNATGISAWDRYDHRFFKFEDDVLRVADSSGRYGSWDRYGDEYPNQRWAPATGTPPDPANPFHWWHENQLEIAARILELVAEGWGCSLEEILRNLTNFGQGTTEHVPVGKDTNGEPVDTLFVAWVAVRPTDSGSVA